LQKYYLAEYLFYSSQAAARPRSLQYERQFHPILNCTIMKRPKIFLGATASCLLLAGIFAAKANHFGTRMAYYYTTGTAVRAHCKCWGKSPSVDEPGGEYVSTVEMNGRMYTLYSDSNCTKKMHYSKD
jgi:hypothetical protein